MHLVDEWADVPSWHANHGAVPRWARMLAVVRQKSGLPVDDLFKAPVEADGATPMQPGPNAEEQESASPC